MDGLCRCVPVTVEIALGGRDFRVRPLTLAGLAAAEAQLLLERPAPTAALGQFAAPVRELIVDQLVHDLRADKARRCVSQADLLAWLDTAAGGTFTAHWCLRPRFATTAAARAFLEKLNADELQLFLRARDAVSGLDLLANLDWPDSGERPDTRFIPWRRLLRWFADEHHWTPAQVGKLTLYQLRVLRAEERELGGRARLAPGEALAYAGTNRQRHRPEQMPARQQARRWFQSTTRAQRMAQRETRRRQA